jgi:hypothetical protein
MPKISKPLFKKSLVASDKSLADLPKEAISESINSDIKNVPKNVMVITFVKKHTINTGNYENVVLELGVEMPINVSEDSTLSEKLKIFRQSLSKISLEVEDALKEKTDEIANI